MAPEPRKKTLCMVPCYNEAANLAELLRDIKGSELPADCGLVFVDDGSRDATVSLLKDSGFPLITHPRNLGYGAAVKSGLRYAKQGNYSNLAVFPGDRQRSIPDLLHLIQEMENGPFDLVVGSKWHSLPGIPWKRALGNRLFSSFARSLWRAPFLDVLSGFKVYRVAAVIPFLESLPDRYEFDLVFSIYCGRFGLAVQEIPVTVHYHAHSSKMKSELLVGLRMLGASLKSLYGAKPIPDPLGE